MSEQIYLIGHREVRTQFSVIGPGAVFKRPIDFYKIGIANNPKQRLSNLRTGTPHELELVTTIASENAKVVESLLHDIYRSGNRSGEWFKLTSNAVNSLIALDRLEPADLEPLTGGLIPSWLTDPTSLYLEVERVRRGDVDD